MTNALSRHLERLRAIDPRPSSHAGRDASGTETQGPAAGDVFAFAATSEQAVLWAVIARARNGEDLFHAVPADSHPLVGSTDVAVAPGSPCGALTLRCGFDLVLAAGDFSSGKRVCRLPPEPVRIAESKRQEIGSGQLRGSVLQRETDQEWEYRYALCEDLELARRALEATLEKRNVVAFEPRNARAQRLAPRLWLTAPRYAAAAALLAGSTLGLLGGAAWRYRDVAALRDTHRTELEHLGVVTDTSFVDQPFLWLTPDDQREGGAPSVEISTGDRYLVLLVPVYDSGPYERYRFDLTVEGSDDVVWSSEFEHSGVPETTLVLPSRLFLSNAYQLRVYGLGSGGEERIGHYDWSVIASRR